MKKVIVCLMLSMVCILSVIPTSAEQTTETEVVPEYKWVIDSKNYFDYSTLDAMIAQKVILGMIEENAYYTDNYDVDRNGELSLLDTLNIQKHSLGMVQISNPASKGNKISKIASTYYVTQEKGLDSFKYSEYSIFDDGYYVRDSEGKGLIDNPIFAGLCVLEIPYEKSPYGYYKGENAVWNPMVDLLTKYGVESSKYFDLVVGLYSKYSEADEYTLDDIMLDVKEYFRQNTEVIYEEGTNAIEEETEVVVDENTSEGSTPSILPGDLVFFKDGTLGIVAENIGKYFAVLKKGIVVYNDFDYNSSDLICRPDYS